MNLQEIYTKVFSERDKKANCFKSRFQEWYSNRYDNRKQLKKLLNILTIITSVILLLFSMINYSFYYFLGKELIVIITYFGIRTLVKIFHELYGVWAIRENDVKITQEYIKESIPRGMKSDGNRGAGKDTLVSGLISVLRDDLIEKILSEMIEIETICYLYNFDELNNYLDENYKLFMVNSRTDFFKHFLSMMEINNCFIKKHYSNVIESKVHIDNLYLVKKNVDFEAIQNVKFQYYNGIDRKHFLTLIIKYSMLYIRINYYENYVVTNQPFLETPHLAAKEFCTDYIKINEPNAQWPWPLVGGVIIFETEADALYTNVGKGTESVIKSGIRNFKAFLRHLLGENSVWITNGQKAKRTSKSLRELDESFISVIEKNIVYGGQKRIYFINRKLKRLRYWMNKTPGKEKKLKKISELTQKIRQLENTGYIYLDIKVSRTDDYRINTQQMSLKKILRYDKPIYENYTTRVCFHITDCFGRFNTRYLEYLAEALARKSKIDFNDLKNWSMDLKMNKQDVINMGYKSLDQVLNIDRHQLEKDKKAKEIAERIKEAKKKEENNEQEKES